MMRKCFVFLFPEKDFFMNVEPKNLGEKQQYLRQFRQIIVERYMKHYYDIEVISFRGSSVFGFDGIEYGVVDIEQRYLDIMQKRGLVDFAEIAKDFAKFGYDEVCVGGFFLSRAVDKFANGLKIASPNTKVEVDIDLTDQMWNFTRTKEGRLSKDFDYGKLSIKNSISNFIEKNSLDQGAIDTLIEEEKLPNIYMSPYQFKPSLIFEKDLEYIEG